MFMFMFCSFALSNISALFTLSLSSLQFIDSILTVVMWDIVNTSYQIGSNVYVVYELVKELVS